MKMSNIRIETDVKQPRIRVRSTRLIQALCERKEEIMKTIVATSIIAIAVSTSIAHANPKLEKRVAELEREVAELKTALAPVIEKARIEQVVSQQRNRARQRMRKDSEIYSREQLREVETLYQVANKQWRSQEGKDSLKELIEKYDKANRTGCALLYLGQMSKGKEREQYLKNAIAEFSDCFYGDGVQVGAYARYYLAYHYKEAGKSNEAERLFREIGERYPNAIDHKGRLLRDIIEE